MGSLVSTQRVGDETIHHYDNGAFAYGCNRSSKFTFKCGSETKVISATEPTTCYYEIVAEVVCGGNVCQNGNCVYDEVLQTPPTCVCNQNWYGDYCDDDTPNYCLICHGAGSTSAETLLACTASTTYEECPEGDVCMIEMRKRNGQIVNMRTGCKGTFFP